MPFKMKDGAIVMEGEFPVFINKEGKEAAFNADTTVANLANVTAESIARKTKIKDMETAALPFAGIENPTEWVTNANKALETVATFNDKDFIEVGKVETAKAALVDSHRQNVTAIEAAHKVASDEKDAVVVQLNTDVKNLAVKGSFASSTFIGEKTTFPNADVAFAYLGHHFDTKRDEAGNVVPVAKRADGSEILSLINHGSAADMEEALEILVNERHDRDTLLKGLAGGGGTPPGGGGGGGGNKKWSDMTEAEHTALYKQSPEAYRALKAAG